METNFLSRFTPSLMPAEALEAIFVQRDDLLRALLERISSGTLTPVKNNTLLVGPRGIGKTHLISLIYYRLRSTEELKNHVRIAWLREEEWGIACFRDFLLRILRALASQDQDAPITAERLSALYALERKDAERTALRLISELVGNRTLVILTENFDDLLHKLGSTEEMQLYRFLQGSGFCSVTATTPGPLDRALPPESPFRQGFFQIHRLQELNFNDAIQLISKIAQYQGNKELAACIATPRGRARVRALRYLAGGNHRAYVTFAPLLTQDSLDQLIKPLMQTSDDLTPYYNSRIADLSLDLRKIIEYVCEGRHPVQIADVARACFIPPATAAAQLEALCKMGHLQSFQIANARYFELHEPLMRLSFEVKKHRGKPIGLLMDFLRLWYSPAELKQKLATLPPQSSADYGTMPPPRVPDKNFEDPRVAECCRDFSVSIQKRDYRRALQAAEDLASMRGLKEDFIAQASCYIHLGQHGKAVAVYDEMLETDGDDASVWQLRGRILNKMGRYEEAFSSCNRSLEIDPKSCDTWCDKASILLNLSNPNEALQACETAVGLDEKSALAWLTRGATLVDLDLFEDALEAFAKAVAMQPQNVKARVHLCAALIELNRYEEAIREAQRAIELAPGEPEAWTMMGLTLSYLGQREDSLFSFNKALSLGEDSSFVQYKVVELLFAQDRWREATTTLDRALSQFAHSGNPNAGDTKALIQCLIPSLSNPKVLQLSIKLLLLVYRKHRMLGALGQGLIESIPEMIKADSHTDSEATLWLESWQMMADTLTEFRLPLRLLDSAVRYRKTQDLRIFMGLPQEERTLLEPLVGVHIEAIA
jgi:tetratricopeptide (TPR) repeat protein